MSPRIGLMGAGKWGINLARNFHALGKLAVICEPDDERVRQIRDKFPGVRFTDNPNSLMADKEISGIAIATPAITHAVLASLALNNGKDVLVEKPMAMSIEDGLNMVETADRNNRILMVGHVLEYHPAVRLLHRLVAEGALGRINYIYSNRLNLGRVRKEENILWSFAPHDLSVIMRLTGVLPTRVSAWGGSWLNPDVADTTVTHMEFEQGIKAHVFVSWLHPFKEQRLVVVGSKAMAIFNDGAPHEEKLILCHQDMDKAISLNNPPDLSKARTQPLPLDRSEPLRLECEDFIRAIQDRKPPLADRQMGLRVLAVLEAAQKSLNRAGEPVSLEALSASATASATTGPVGSSKDIAGHQNQPPVTRSLQPQIHPSAIVDLGCTIGEGTKIWHFTHIDSGATIGKSCNLGQNVYVASGASIGNNVKIQNNVSIYKGVSLEDDVFCGPSTVFTNVLIPRSHHPRRDEYLSTTVRQGATIGANSTIVCGTTIGRYAFVGAGAVVTDHVPDYALVIGNPAKIMGWRCICGEEIKFNTVNSGSHPAPGSSATCIVCSKSYSVDGDGVVVEEASILPTIEPKLERAAG